MLRIRPERRRAAHRLPDEDRARHASLEVQRERRAGGERQPADQHDERDVLFHQVPEELAEAAGLASPVVPQIQHDALDGVIAHRGTDRADDRAAVFLHDLVADVDRAFGREVLDAERRLRITEEVEPRPFGQQQLPPADPLRVRRRVHRSIVAERRSPSAVSTSSAIVSSSSAMPRPVRTSALVRNTMRAARRLDGVSRGTTGSSRSNTSSIGMPSTFRTRAPSRSPLGALAAVTYTPSGNSQSRIGNRWTASGLSGGQTPMWPSPPRALIIATRRITPTSISSSSRSGIAAIRLVGGTMERRRRHAVEQIRVDVLHLFHQVRDVGRPPLDAGQCGGRHGDARRARRRDGSVRGRAGSGREDEQGDGDERSDGAAIACVRDSTESY